jgi:(heptosyl)LPS beta-1,4-glucosyltransferase
MSRMRPRISVTIITLNEQEKLPECLESVAWADEVVVLDAGSSDETRTLAADHGAVVRCEPWKGFVEHKNRAAELASNDWILNIDADERVSGELMDEIEQARFDAPAYAIPRVSDFLGAPHRPVHRPKAERLVRLYDRRRARFGEGLVHEKVDVTGRSSRMDGPIYHEGFRSIEDMANRLNRYSSLLAQERPVHRLRGLLVKPPARLLWALFRHKLVLDGRRGLILAGMWAHHDLLVEAKRFEASEPQREPFPSDLYPRASVTNRPSQRRAREVADV